MSYTCSMKRSQQPRSGLALGGMGSGWFELRQDGRFCNWNIANNQPYGTGPRLAPGLAENALWFAVRFHEQGSQPLIKLLQLPSRHDAASLIVQVATDP